MQIQSEQKKFILSVLKEHLPQAKIIAFGSRIKNQAKTYSDLDLAIDNGMPISLNILVKLEDAFSNSTIPFKIELIDFRRISKEFQQHILKEGQLLK